MLPGLTLPASWRSLLDFSPRFAVDRRRVVRTAGYRTGGTDHPARGGGDARRGAPALTERYQQGQEGQRSLWRGLIDRMALMIPRPV